MFVYISPEANIVDTRGTPTPTIQKEPSKNKTQTSLKGQNGTISPASQGLSSRCACIDRDSCVSGPQAIHENYRKIYRKISGNIRLDEETVPEVSFDFQLLPNIALQSDNFKETIN